MAIEIAESMTLHETIAYLLATATTVVSGFLLFRRRLSKDNVEVAKNRQEVDVMAVLAQANTALLAENATLRREHGDVMRELGRLTAMVSMMPEIYKAQLNLTAAVDSNTRLTEKASEAAVAAYKEANTVNKKIETIGLQVKDGSRLNPQAPQNE